MAPRNTKTKPTVRSCNSLTIRPSFSKAAEILTQGPASSKRDSCLRRNKSSPVLPVKFLTLVSWDQVFWGKPRGLGSHARLVCRRSPRDVLAVNIESAPCVGRGQLRKRFSDGAGHPYGRHYDIPSVQSVLLFQLSHRRARGPSEERRRSLVDFRVPLAMIAK